MYEALALRPHLIKVVMADDHGLFRVGLATALSDYHDIAVLGQASRGTMAIRLVAELRPDVVVMDADMPDLDGAETARAVLATTPSARVVVLAEDSDEATIRAMIQAGVCGYVFKDAAIDHIVGAIRAVASGALYLAPRAAEVVLRNVRRLHDAGGTTEASTVNRLSAREAEVLGLLALGLDNKAIAEALSISPRTAKNHVASILSKLGLSNRIQAAVFAVRAGIV